MRAPHVARRTRQAERRTSHVARCTWLCGFLALSLMPGLAARQETAGCKIAGRAASGGTPLPGVSVVVIAAEAVKAVTSSGLDGTFHLALPPGAYMLRAELTGFAPVEQALELGAAPCDRPLELLLTLMARQRPAPSGQPPAPGAQRQGP